MNYMKNENIEELREDIDGIPCIILRPRWVEKNIPTVIFYHGWGSSKEGQRFRGYNLASFGYQVVLPDALYHGERGSIDYNTSNGAVYFWDIVKNTVNESEALIEEILNRFDADRDRLGIIGHSMGGITSAGVFARHKEISTLVTMNGSCNWRKTSELLAKGFEIEDWENLTAVKELGEYDPMGYIEDLVDRPILMLHGKADMLISPLADLEFVDLIKKDYENVENIDIIEFERLGHFVTTNMLEDALIWFRKHL